MAKRLLALKATIFNANITTHFKCKLYFKTEG
jgi:hypothetical protein